MARHIHICGVCKQYTMKIEHCGQKTENPKPPKYSPIDQYGKYRREAKQDIYKKEGLL